MDYSLGEDMIGRFFEKTKSFILPSEDNNYKSRFLQSNLLLYCVVLILALKIVTTLVSINFPQNVFFADITKSALENFANQARQSTGLPALVENGKLGQAARLKAENMVQNQYFDHTSPSGVTPWFWFSKVGYNYKYAGENLAIGFYDSKEVYDAWINSPSHKANILNPNYKEVGTAVLRGFGENNAVVVVQEFGTQLPVKQSIAKTAGKPSSVVVAPTATVDTNERVLSQTAEPQNFIESAPEIKTAAYSFDKWLQSIIYGVSLIVIGVLFAIIILSNSFNFKRALVFRTVLIIVLLSAGALISREAIVSLIPHQIII